MKAQSLDQASPAHAPGSTVDLPPQVRACLFDLDGVLTRTAAVHEAAWKEAFDEFLSTRSDAGHSFEAFSLDDYDRYVDGKPRADGTRSFLASRGISLPEGDVDDAPGVPTVQGLGNRKNELFLHRLASGHVEVFDGSIRFVRAVRAEGLATAVVSSSANAVQVLVAAGIDELFDARIDGLAARQRGLAGKPAPDTFLAGAAALGVGPARGRGVRGCARRCRSRAHGRVRARRGCGSPRSRRRAAQTRRRCRRRRSHRVAAAVMITHPAYTVEPWCVRESSLDLDLLAQSESVFALSNGHVGLRGNLDEGEPHGLPGSYLNSVCEQLPMTHAESGFGYPAHRETVINVTNGKLIRLFVDDEPFDVRYGTLHSHERVLDLRAGTLTPAPRTGRLRSENRFA